LEFSIRYLVGKIPHEQLLRHEILPMERRSLGDRLHLIDSLEVVCFESFGPLRTSSVTFSPSGGESHVSPSMAGR
jgi:hypothetical protein